MKKYIIIIFLLLVAWCSPSSSFALTYNGSTTFEMPNIYSSWFVQTLAFKNKTSDSYLNYFTWSTVDNTYTYLWCSTIWNSSSWTKMNLYQYGYYWYGWLVAIYEMNIKIIPTGANNESIVSLYSNSVGAPIFSHDIMVVPTIPNSKGWDTTQWMFCISPRMKRIAWSWVANVDWIYLYDIKYSYYSWPTGVFGFDFHSFTSYGIYWRQVYRDSTYATSYPFFEWHNRGELQPWDSSTWTTIYFRYLQTVMNWAKVTEFMNDIVPSSLNNTIPQWLWVNFSSTWSTYEYPPTGTGSGSWSIWFDYSSCWAISISCYFWVFTNGILGYIWSFFPDVSWNSAFNSCASWSIDKSSYLQKFANIIAIINPYPPAEGTIVCSIFWQYTIGYQRLIPEKNFFEIYIPWVMPALENDWRIIFWQSIPDIIVILSFAILILNRKQND